MSRRVLYDTNVLLDIILLRSCAPPTSPPPQPRSTLRQPGPSRASSLGHAITDSAVRLALAMDLSDSEDAATVASAQEAGCDRVVTRNLQHFREAALKAILPEALVVSETKPD